MNHYRGRVATWDVVNEALADDGSLRNCTWSRVIGTDWVEQAFRIARSVDPRCAPLLQRGARRRAQPEVRGDARDGA